ncbi:MAG: oligosaccharide flippase family protein [Clostridia bacterium]
MKKQSFVSGAFLLALAVGLGKIFSAVFKIPLDRFFLHAEGMAIFNTSYNIYMFFFAMATAGIPMAISSLIALSRDKREEDEIFSTALISVLVLMILSSLAIFIFAPLFANLSGMEDAVLSLKIMAPALIFIAPIAALRGYFQGKLYMTPSALSQLSDSLGRLLFGFLGAFLFLNYPLHICAASALSGVPLGAFLSFCVLLIFFVKTKNKLSLGFSWGILKKILFLAIPITLTVSLHSIFNMIDTVSVVPMLKSFGFSSPKTAFGCLSRAATLYALPFSIASAVSSGILPSVSDSVKSGNLKALVSDSSMAIRLSLLVSLPCTAGFMAVADDILLLLYDNCDNYMTLVLIAPSAVFLSVGSALCAILQGMGKTKMTVISAVTALVCKAVLNPIIMYFFGVNGVALSTSLAYFSFMLLLVIFTIKQPQLKYRKRDVLLKPLVCGFLCFICAFWLNKYIPLYITILCTAIVYALLVLLTKFISKDEITQIFNS